MTKLVNNKFLSKTELYLMMDLLRKHLHLPQDYLPLDSIGLAKKVCKNACIEQIHFNTVSICGILYVGENTTSIALNANRTETMQNFDCCHELIHYFCHDIKECQCVCAEKDSETKTITQSPYFEWQANEGAAELLVPYKTFIPLYVDLSRKYARSFPKTPPEHELADIFHVTDTVIHNRILSLNYEIYQYMQHGDINKVILLSQNKQRQMGWNKNHMKSYCSKCLSPVNKTYNFCPVCGTEFPKNSLHRMGYIFTGAGYMKYEGIELNEHGLPIECPNCKNEDIVPDSEHCIICGDYILNQCINRDCDYNEQLLPGNARYCPYCGSETTYLRHKFLEKCKQDVHDRLTMELAEEANATKTIIPIPPGFNTIPDDDVPF